MYLDSSVKTDLYLNVVNNRLNIYYSNIDKFTVYIDGEEYKRYVVTNKPTVESKVLDIPVSEMRNKLMVEHTKDSETTKVYWNNTWDFIE